MAYYCCGKGFDFYLSGMLLISQSLIFHPEMWDPSSSSPIMHQTVACMEGNVIGANGCSSISFFKGIACKLAKCFSISYELLSDLCRLQLLQLRMQSRVHSSIGFTSELGKICGHISMQKCMTFSLLFHVSSYR